MLEFVLVRETAQDRSCDSGKKMAHKHQSEGVRVRFRVRFQAVKVQIFGGFPVENPTKKANRLKALLRGISLSEYGSEGFRVRLRGCSETGRIRFRGVRFQTPNSVRFLGLTEFRGANSVSSSQPIICVFRRTHRVFCRTHRVCRRT